jgi:hypothetical protein
VRGALFVVGWLLARRNRNHENRLVALFVLMASSSWSQTAPPRLTLDWEAMAKRIVQQLAFSRAKFLAVAHPGTFGSSSLIFDTRR